VLTTVTNEEKSEFLQRYLDVVYTSDAPSAGNSNDFTILADLLPGLQPFLDPPASFGVRNKKAYCNYFAPAILKYRNGPTIVLVHNRPIFFRPHFFANLNRKPQTQSGLHAGYSAGTEDRLAGTIIWVRFMNGAANFVVSVVPK